MADGSCCSHYQSLSKVLPLVLPVKLYCAQMQSRGTGHKILAPQRETATIPSPPTLSLSLARISALAAGSAISSAHHPKATRSHRLSHSCRKGTCPTPRESLGDKGSRAVLSTHGCCCAPLAQSRREDAEAGTAGQAGTSDKYNKSRPSNQ